MHYYQRNIGDYAKKTGHLTALEHGVYNLIIDGYYDREQGPTLVEATRWARARTEEEKAAVLAILDEFFDLQPDGRHTQSRVEEELGAYKSRADKNREIAVAREAKKRGPSVHEACTSRAPSVHQSDQNREPNHKPITNNQEPVTNEPVTKVQAALDMPTTSVKTAGEKTNATGSRLPADWKPSQADIDYCKTERPDLLPSRVASNFYDYWIAIPGSKGRKLDWSATWRGWVRKESAQSAGRSGGVQSNLSIEEQNRINSVKAREMLFGKRTQTSTSGEEGWVLENE